ncbi:MAG: HlyC/CorC family transporter [Planctomycetes bacterium]|nr:HlyC/CorC family transporter [Planctomycetota bacterium]
MLAGLLFFASFLFALAAFSLRDFSRRRLEELCRKRGRETRFSDILKRYEDVLLAVDIVFAVLAMLLIGVVVRGHGLLDSFPSGWNNGVLYFGTVLALLLAFVLSLIVLPWTIARVAGEPFLARTWGMFSAVAFLLRPCVAVIHKLDGFMHRLTGRPLPDEGDAAAITEEILTVVDEGQREGVLESEARTMIHRVMELAAEDTAAIMTPRTNMVCIRADASVEQAREQLLAAGHSRIPIIGDTTDDIVGVLYAKDLLRHFHTEKGRDLPLKEIARKPYYVPESTPIDTLLENMKRKRVHLAIVVDEYGGVAGLVSLEDILEEIVGEIVDEYDSAEETGIQTVSPGVIEVLSRVHIDDLNEQFDYGLPEDGDFDTIGGFVFRELGRIPTAGENFTWRHLQIIVQSADERRILRIRIESNKSPATAATNDV